MGTSPMKTKTKFRRSHLLRRFVLVPLGLGLLSLSSGCDWEDWERGLDDALSCSEAPVLNLAGVWQITGEGERIDCDNANLRGRFTLRTEGRLQVTQSGTEEGVTHTLGLADAPAGVALYGDVRGACVEAYYDEVVGGQRLLYTFSGEGSTGAQVTGTFVGEGPGTCRSRGEFVLQVR